MMRRQGDRFDIAGSKEAVPCAGGCVVGRGPKGQAGQAVHHKGVVRRYTRAGGKQEDEDPGPGTRTNLCGLEEVYERKGCER